VFQLVPNQSLMKVIWQTTVCINVINDFFLIYLENMDNFKLTRIKQKNFFLAFSASEVLMPLSSWYDSSMTKDIFPSSTLGYGEISKQLSSISQGVQLSSHKFTCCCRITQVVLKIQGQVFHFVYKLFGSSSAFSQQSSVVGRWIIHPPDQSPE